MSKKFHISRHNKIMIVFQIVSKILAAVVIFFLCSEFAASEEKVNWNQIDLGVLKVDLTKNCLTPNALCAVATNDASGVIIEMKCKFSEKERGHSKIGTSCGCAEIIRQEPENNIVNILIKVALPFNNGRQIFSVLFRGQDGKIACMQEIIVIKGDGKCILGRADVSLRDFGTKNSLLIPIRILGESDITATRVHLEQGDKLQELPVTIMNLKDSLISVIIKDPGKSGLLWLVIDEQHGTRYRVPLLVTE